MTIPSSLPLMDPPVSNDLETVNPSMDMDHTTLSAQANSAQTMVSLSESPPSEQAAVPSSVLGWRVFGSTFVTIFLAELGDKTQITTLLMTAESHAPWVVFIGAASALITTSLLGVLVGQWLARHIAPRTLDRAAGMMLLLVGTLLVWDILH